MRLTRIPANLWLLCQFRALAGRAAPPAVRLFGERGLRFTMDFDVLT
jgi:hypothetical protein